MAAEARAAGLHRTERERLFDAGSVLLGYIRWLKDDARRNNKSEGAKRTEELRQEKLELEIAKTRGELVEFEMVEAFFAESHVHLRTIFGGIPAGLTRDPALRATFEKRFNDGCDEYRSAFEAMARSGPPSTPGDVP